jgi:hypothetical protein
VQGFGGKARRKETTWKSEGRVAVLRGWNEDETLGNCLGGMWSGFSWLSIGTGGGVSQTQR